MSDNNDDPEMSLSAPSNIGFGAYMTPFTPQNYGRPSSPLNPHAGSSSPITSPTPQYASHPHLPMHHYFPAPPSAEAGPSRPLQRPRNGSGIGNGRVPSFSSPGSGSSSRFGRRPTAPAHTRSAGSSAVVGGLGGPLDLFTEGTSPVQGQLWRDRLGRRMEERERRKRARENEMGRRRDIEGDDADQNQDQEAADRRAQEDDEEIFRRLMVLQRRKAQHAVLVSHEMETGGSDPLEPDFWEDEMSDLEKEERELAARSDGHVFQPPSHALNPTQHPYQQPPQHSFGMATPPPRMSASRAPNSGTHDATMGSYREQQEEEEDWAEEAAAAEEAERVAEEAEMVDRAEREFMLARGGGVYVQHGGGGGMDMDWDGFEQMDFE